LSSKTTTLICLFSISATALGAQAGLYPLGAAAVGMGNITTLHTDVWSALTNPAGLGMAPAFAAGAQHEQRYAIPGLGIDSFAATVPVWGGGIGLSLASISVAEQGESRFGIQAGRKLGAHFAAGVGFHAHRLRFPAGYRNAFALSADAGIYATPAPRLSMGVYVSNLGFSRFNNEARSRLPVVFRWGAGYDIAPDITLGAEVEKDPSAPLRAKTGVEYLILKALYMRLGVLSQPFEIHYGLGYRCNPFQADFALYRHPVLGFSPQLSLSLAFR
jgi:hypothetical protein